MIVQRVGLQQIDDVEAVSATSSRIGDPEVVPLGEAASVVVRLQNQVVLELVDLDCAS